MGVAPKRLNYATFTKAIMKRTIGKLKKHLSLLNCEVGCVNYESDARRYIPTDVIGGPTLSKMLHEIVNPPDFIIDSMRSGIFCEETYAPSTPAGFGLILENIKDAGQIKDLIDELKEIIRHDPFMESSDRIRLLGFRHKRKFLYECFVYTLTHKGNTGRRPKRKEARRIQAQAQKNTERISNAVQVLYDEETADENTDEGQ